MTQNQALTLCRRQYIGDLEITLYIAGIYTGADKSLARPTSRCILFDGENISLVLLYVNK